MNGPEAEKAALPLLWEFVPLSNYAIPGHSSPEVVRKKWLALKQWFRRNNNNDAEQLHGRAEEELRALPIMRLENLVPPIDWTPAVDAFDCAMAEASSRRSSRSVTRFLIGQPHNGHVRILEGWAAAHGAQLVSPPGYEDILSGSLTWLPETGTTRRVWALPALERCFLRHANGLSSVRTFLERALSGDLGEGVIGCDSWAWAYLQRIWPVADPQILTLQSFDGRRLADYFIRTKMVLANRRIRFCNARTGASLILESESTEGGSSDVGAELRQLAAHCRGNLGVAWKYWRERLRAEPDPAQSDSSPADPEAGEEPSGEELVWVASDIEDPVLPAETEEEVGFILHALLIHNGLPSWLLPELFLIPNARIVSNLLRIETLGLIEPHNDGWRVTALGYATTREFLRARDYLIDRF
jgi:hypothetical protein